MRDVPIDLAARVRLAHAVTSQVAADASVDGLFIKGPALDPSLATPDRGSDVDFLVRPSHLDRFLRQLRSFGWELVTDFTYGSVFEHAANYRHRDFGYLDLHRRFPGITIDDEHAFDLLWAEHRTTQIAHRECRVPSTLDQRLVLCLHAARGGGASLSERDLKVAWHSADEPTRSALIRRAEQMGAQVALAATTGTLHEHAADPTAELWRVYYEGGSRVEEWRARFRAATGVRAKLRVVRQSALVNHQFEAMLAGGELSLRDTIGVAARRLRTALRELTGNRFSKGDR